ncbi:MAG: peptidase M10A and M12B matrixin and adamalysin [Puniceicoccaceae bacterium 5H]|nr:MAG: peptidase M10A and M12B matrixin and adamalysin [Puniceicoccaceae bacterium 5H]
MLKQISCLSLLSLATASLSAITFTFDYSYDSNDFFSGANVGRRAYLEQAGSLFESLLTDNFSAISPGGSLTYTQQFSNPGTGEVQSATDVPVAQDEIIVYAGGRDLGGSTLGRGGPGGWNASGNSSFFSDIRRGQGDTIGATADDFGVWGGSISFDSDSSWYFDDDISTVESFAGQYDFYSVAIHELGHLLGMGTADSWDNLIDGGNFFTGAKSMEVYGGPVPLQSSGGHFSSGVESETIAEAATAQEAAMDPDIASNVRKYFTLLDVAALDDLGWDIDYANVPEPRTTALLGGLAALGLIAFRRRQRC